MTNPFRVIPSLKNGITIEDLNTGQRWELDNDATLYLVRQINRARGLAEEIARNDSSVPSLKYLYIICTVSQITLYNS
jgi:hypothetical protein